MSWLMRRRKSADTYGQFCTDEEADRCRAEIDRLVDDFLARCRSRGRIGAEDLGRSKNVYLGHTPVRTSLAIRGTGSGWRHLKPGLFGLCVQNDGFWHFAGYHTWRQPPGAPTVELSLWHLFRGGGWPNIAWHERYNVAEVATGTPPAAVAAFEEAIARWEGRPRNR